VTDEAVTEAGRAGVAALLADPGRALLGVDFDGTLAPIVGDPDAARAHPGAVPALVRVAAHGVSVAVVTGRPAETAVAYGGLAGVAGLDRLVVLGAYGRERWEARTGSLVAPEPHPGVDAARAALPGLLAQLGVPAWVEDKGSAVAVHTRRLPEPAAALETLRAPLSALALEQGLAVEPGRNVLELRPPGADKGAAVHSLVGDPPPSAVVFVGDDLGDLAAFDAVDELRADGVPGVLVCSGSTEVTALADRADVVVDGPPGVVAWLEALADALDARRAPSPAAPS
jgi:trehalose 6-phosphate phosphatase